MRNKKHINSIPEIHSCTSCQMCYAICPTDAISIKLNDDGFYRPHVDENVCIGCSRCIKICYKFSDDLDRCESTQLKDYQHYAAITKNNKLLQESSSGGIAPEVAELLHSKGYKVVGVSYNADKDIAEHKVARCSNDLHLFKGSKYIHADNREAFKEIVTKAKTDGERYAFFGLPCEIYALAKYADINHIRDQFLLIDLYCHGVPSYLIWNKYISELKKLQPSISYDTVNFRSKKHSSWGRFQIELSNKGNESIMYGRKEDPFFELFFSNQLLNASCQDCVLRGNLSYSDMRLGDFWGPKYIFNTTGCSLVSANTERGEQILTFLGERVSVKKCDVKDFAQYQSLFNLYPIDYTLRDNLLDQLKNKSLSLANTVDDYYKYFGLMGRLKRKVKNMLAFLPYKYTQYLKYIYYALK
ncbi:MAG: Coenzyme F420 hydrogenase/dehydrogenase, beta subunit C-terminal domain [Bacteroidales bacterium]|uniref:Coenzyme F420 hydrogenase/dehydrogenase, beta subunit C-terminal domain n=1 Tax=Porphyromonas sp. TaxID=1924944 RepID=UPI00297714DB|nr:Coenzyme F420 hydrogenase/dehydrogenase, beta subunit C-terminal domain [Porphyromonas sp.]MDD7438333.1 Coenzyme F420 hydrogenase/dehydrogenase, beta subunit C-terminal domain [Bacteroidales bacterium]MDY3066758.1 Coenzyme F420 hydrogenase/dehydrogenase, beta subunit C-terminal domain [Porphyromonas sp.]